MSKDTKGIRVKDILTYIEELAPTTLAESWDNVGLLVGNPESPVEKVFLALDVCEETLKEAIGVEADLIVTHHPFIFSGMKRILQSDIKGSQIMRLITNGVSIISEHTNEDCADTGLNAYLAKMLGVENAQPFTDTTFLRVGDLDESVSCEEFAKLVKDRLNICTIRATNVGPKMIKKVGVFTGKVDLDEVLAHKEEFDVLVCGELGYHSALTLTDEDVLAFECGHYGSENIFRQMMKELLSDKFPALEICISECDSDPYKGI